MLCEGASSVQFQGRARDIKSARVLLLLQRKGVHHLPLLVVSMAEEVSLGK